MWCAMICAMTTQPAEDVPGDTIANRLMLARAHAGHISQRRASVICGVGRGTWPNWERGVYSPRVDDLRRIASGLGVNLQWLVLGGPLAPEQPDGGGGPANDALPRLDSNQKPAGYTGGYTVRHEDVTPELDRRAA